ncbi:MAG: ARPP-1 family domain-containing protein [Candidatus Thorarchaeota archaeon]
MNELRARSSADLIRLIEGCTITEPHISGNMAVSGLVDANAELQRELLSFDLALDLQKLTIDETGNVPSLVFNTDQSILIRAGEAVLGGGKQDRVVRESAIIDGRRSVDVFCIEAGRWTPSNQGWIHVDVPVSLRRLILSGADQNQVWGHVAELLSLWGISSQTGALGAIYESFRGQFSMRAARFGRWDKQIGMIVTIDNVVMGVEMFGDIMSFGRDSMSLLTDAYVPNAMQRTEGTLTVSHVRKAVTDFLEDLQSDARCVEIVEHKGKLAYASAI